MKKELQDKLYEKYPKIFKQKDDNMTTTCLCWGLECGDGWYWIIDNLCDSIQGYIDANKKEQMEATQVKEKFGSLSFYRSGGDRLIGGMIWLAEHMSYNTCELCGSTEDIIQTKGWIKIRCKKCLEKEKDISTKDSMSVHDMMFGKIDKEKENGN